MVCGECHVWRARADELNTRLSVALATRDDEVAAVDWRHKTDLEAARFEAARMAMVSEQLELERRALERDLQSARVALQEEATRAGEAQRESERLQQVIRSLERAVSSLIDKEAAGRGRTTSGHADLHCTRWTQTSIETNHLDSSRPAGTPQLVDVAVGGDVSSTPRSASASSPRVERRSTSPDARPMFRLNVPLPSVSRDRVQATSANGVTFLRRSSTPFLSTSRGVSFARVETPRHVGSWQQAAGTRSASRSVSQQSASSIAVVKPAAASHRSLTPPTTTSRASLGAQRERQVALCSKVSLPPGGLEKKYLGVRDAFAELRGLVLRADASMFVTLASVHTLRDCGCPLKLSIAKIKQTILAQCPALHKRIRDGHKWDIQRSDLLGLGEEAAGPIAASLREMVAAHDYLRYHQRTESLQSALNEVYENVDLWVQLARSRRVQLIIN